ncbi:MAG: phosphatidylglycerol lysyltransferase domain-containing protein [Treponema sp.]|nr:phosphatidylglycerol lysyltransferase domain-containing protein [Treponema sp.]
MDKDLPWKKSSLADLENFHKAAVNNSLNANNYSSVNSILYQKKYNSHVCIVNNWLLEKYLSEKKMSFAFPHNLSGDSSKINEILKVIKEAATAQGKEICFCNLTRPELEILQNFFDKDSMTIHEADFLSDYIYLTQNLANLPGSKYSKKRNHLNQFKKAFPNYEFKLLDKERILDVLSIEDKWLEERIGGLKNDEENSEEQKQDLLYEKEIIHQALENFDYFKKTADLSGGLLYINQEAAAFCISSQLSDEVTDIHFEKSLEKFASAGAYALINNEFAKTVKTKYINREEDLGIPGLRKAKLSYYPEIILEKFLVKINL